jgi:hypothetical protein
MDEKFDRSLAHKLDKEIDKLFDKLKPLSTVQ